MTDNKRRFKTKIAGRNYTILAKKPAMHLQAVSEIVNSKIMQIKEAMPALDVEQRSVLVTINTISEMIEKQEEVEHLKEIITKLEKINETQQKKIQNLNQSEANVSQAKILIEPVEQEKIEKKQISPRKQKKASSRFVRPTTTSGVVLQRANMKDKRENKEIPPYSKKKERAR
ncbi:cell division protein ZapA [Jeotgalibaca sp. MA1X17-3]|uniref:cell division protein ZapA n=1 Tax=Jeotgalibaca sp. MA1X17-3 TaxID=2908211 RepID=UPI001F024264|nr:cell division protein ZapA [Jeotgalibaca sp. MA1X17-3]UJF14643.1 cell division protein ZapA [Jeotgalibaca sp. MA1X17-3]